MAFFRDLATSPLLDDAYFEADLLRYFPKPMRTGNAADISAHRLRREIVATMITNSIVNRTGFSFAHELMRATGLPAADIAQAYIATRDAFDLRDLWAEIEALEGETSAQLQSQLFARLNRFIEHHCRWFLLHKPQPAKLADIVETYHGAIREIEATAESLMSDSVREAYAANIARLTAQVVPETLATSMAKLDVLNSACDVIDIARLTKKPLLEAGRIYFNIGDMLKLGWLREAAHSLTADSYWQQLAIKSLAIEFYAAQRRLTLTAIERHGKKKGDAVTEWEDSNAAALARHHHFLNELRAQMSLDYPMLIVALRQVQAITSL
jgi:glutamate dehydrogenase